MTQPSQLGGNTAANLAAWRAEGRAFGTAWKRHRPRHVITRDEDTGQANGWDVEHWDGRRDCTVTPPTVRARTSMEAG